MSEIILQVGTYEDKQWLFTVVNFQDLTNFTLLSQIRDSAGVFAGSMSALAVGSNQFTLSIESAVSGSIIPGTYQTDVLATSTIDGKRYFITPIIEFIVLDRVTEPI